MNEECVLDNKVDTPQSWGHPYWHKKLDSSGDMRIAEWTITLPAEVPFLNTYNTLLHLVAP